MNRIDDRLCQEDALRTLGIHSAAIIHELRAPLAAVYAQLQTMERLLGKQGNHTQDERFSLLYEEIQYMNTLLDQYLLLAGQRPPQAGLFFLRQAVNDMLRLLKSLLLKNNIECSFLAEGSAPPLYSDERLVKQILLNLITNAIEAMPEGGKLELKLTAGSSEQSIMVRDTGCGMDADTLRRIFDPFFTTKSRGSGLGLAISRQLAEGLGGRLRAISTPGQGSTFILTLPNHTE